MDTVDTNYLFICLFHTLMFRSLKQSDGSCKIIFILYDIIITIELSLSLKFKKKCEHD